MTMHSELSHAVLPGMDIGDIMLYRVNNDLVPVATGIDLSFALDGYLWTTLKVIVTIGVYCSEDSDRDFNNPMST